MKYLVKSAMLLIIASTFTPMDGQLAPTDLRRINSKTSFNTKKELITKGITPENLAKIEPEVINNILDHDDAKNLQFTRFIIQNINHLNISDLKPVTIRNLVRKAGKEASDHIIGVFKGFPALFIYIKPTILNQFIDVAGADYALALAKLIKSDMLYNPNLKPTIKPDILILLIEANTQAANQIMQLINKDNLAKIDSTVKMALKDKLGDDWQNHLKKIVMQAKKDVPTKEEPKRKATFLEKIGLGNNKK